MYNIGEDDNELDRLSREAASEYKAPGNADWETMLEQLDKNMPQEKKKRRFLIFWWLLPALVAGSFMLWKFYPQPATSTVAATIPASDKIAAPKTNIAPIPEQAAEKEISNRAIPLDMAGPVAKQAITQVAISREPAQKELPMQLAGLPVTKTDNPSAPASAPLTSTQLHKPVQDISVSVPDNTKAAQDQVTETKKEQVTVNEVKESIPVTATEEPVVKTVAKQKNKQAAWSLGIIGGVDKSTVKFRYGYDPGYNLGLLLGYHFNDRWSLHSGAVYTQKNYKMAGADFTAPKGSWASYYNLETVEGYCRMWDVPVLVRYNISHSDNRNIFLSTGLSSYFMTKEDYTYTYYTTTGQLATRNTAYNSTNTHVLSIVHLSAGFESRVGTHTFISVEPYAKIPLGGVGLGNIQLSSFGVNLSVQFRQPVKK